jgi:hypothetical protein
MFLDFRYCILPFCFWVILWKDYNSISQICVTWQHDSPIKVSYKFWSTIPLIEGCEIKIMENWTWSVSYIYPLGSYEWLYIALEFYSIPSLCKSRLSNNLECMLNFQNIIL